MKMSDSDKRALILLGSFGLAMGLYLLVIEPISLRYKAAVDGIEAAEDAIHKTEKDRKLMGMRRMKYQERKQELNQLVTVFGGRMPPAQRISAAMSDVQRAAEQAKVKLGEVRPLDSKSTDEKGIFDEQLFQLEFTGNYDQLMRMLYLLETGRGLMQVLQCDMTTKDGNDIQARVLAKRSYLHEPELNSTSLQPQAPMMLLRAGAERRPGLGGLYIAERNGFLADPLAGVSLIYSDQALEYFRRGDLDAIVVGQTEFLALGAEGHPVTAVMALSRFKGGAGLAVPLNGVKDAKSLAGKRVAVQKNGASQQTLTAVLARAGVKLGEVRIVELTQAQASDALIVGDADAAVLFPPFLSKVVESGKARVLPIEPADAGQRIELLVVRTDTLSQKPDAVRRLVEAALQGNEWWNSNRAIGDGIVAQSLWCSSDEVAGMRGQLELFDLNANAKLLSAAGESELKAEFARSRVFLQEQAGIEVPENLLQAFSDEWLKRPAPATAAKKEGP